MENNNKTNLLFELITKLRDLVSSDILREFETDTALRRLRNIHNLLKIKNFTLRQSIDIRNLAGRYIERLENNYGELQYIVDKHQGSTVEFTSNEIESTKSLISSINVNLSLLMASIKVYNNKKQILNSEDYYRQQIESLQTELNNKTTETAEQQRDLQHQIEEYKKQLQEKKKQDSAIVEWNNKIKTTFDVLTAYLKPIRFERRKLQFLFGLYVLMTVAAIGFIIYFEVLICSKVASMNTLPAWQDYLFVTIPIPIAGALLWVFISQANRAQRQAVILAKYIHEIGYIEGLLLSINSLSSDINDSMGRVNAAIDQLLENHLNASVNLRNIDETYIMNEEKKDVIPYDLVIKLLKEAKGLVDK